MNYEIKQLDLDDFDEAIDFINLVFSMVKQPIDFLQYLPNLYQPTTKHMQCHYVIRVHGRIKALVGIYPGELVIGDVCLKIARIGAVSTHPYYREKGMMKALMDHSINIIHQEGYDIGYLGGRRHRYLYHGFEVAGCRISYEVNKRNIKHKKIDNSNLEIRKIENDNDSIIVFCKQLHDQQLIHFNRAVEDFYTICHHWKAELFGIYQHDKLSGYFVFNNRGAHLWEICAINSELACKAIYTFLENNEYDEIHVSLSPLDLQLNQLLGEFFERSEIKDVHNWSIYHWEKVIAAFLKVKNKVLPLQNGEVTIGVIDYGKIKIIVQEGLIDCFRTEEEADITVTSTVGLRLLFGPLPPSYVMDLPLSAQILNSWCPLPLCMSPQDFA